MYYDKWRNLASSLMAQKKTRAVPGYLTVARMHRTVTIPSEHSRTQSVPSRSPLRPERSEKLSLGIRAPFTIRAHAGPDQQAANETLHSDILAGEFRNAYSPTIGAACLPRCSCSHRFLTRSRSVSLSPSQNKSESEVVGTAPSFWCV